MTALVVLGAVVRIEMFDLLAAIAARRWSVRPSVRPVRQHQLISVVMAVEANDREAGVGACNPSVLDEKSLSRSEVNMMLRSDRSASTTIIQTTTFRLCAM